MNIGEVAEEPERKSNPRTSCENPHISIARLKSKRGNTSNKAERTYLGHYDNIILFSKYIPKYSKNISKILPYD